MGKLRLYLLTYPINPTFGGGMQKRQLCHKVLKITLTASAKSRLTTPNRSTVGGGGGVVMGRFVYGFQSRQLRRQ